ncbi:DUF1648 domain-containing protein [Humibacter sp.]|uniref:DUF1648 domain-containing protein n=1 Tax=Humibacter sp. TaxID=1940291 RepID=UPI003F80C4E0
MTAFAIVFTIAVTTVIAALLLAMPSIVRPTLPLGVSVPTERVGDPAVRGAVRLYRWCIAIAWLVCVIVGVIGALVIPALAVAIMPLVFLVLSFLAYVTVRRRILAAKRGGGWYAGKPTRLVADASPRDPGHPPIGWLLASLAVVCAVVALGITVYASLPDIVPVHWGGGGHVDRTAPKSVWSVFSLPIVAGALSVGLYGMSWITRSNGGRPVASDTPEQAAMRADAQRHLASTGLGVLSLALTLGLGVAAATSWLAPSSPGIMFASIGLTLILTLGAAVAIVVTYARAMSHANAMATAGRDAAAVNPATHPAPSPRAEAPDDDRYWKLGVLCVNRDDPATFVPKRFGVGWTINLGSPGGIAFGLIAVVVVVGSLVASMVAGATR